MDAEQPHALLGRGVRPGSADTSVRARGASDRHSTPAWEGYVLHECLVTMPHEDFLYAATPLASPTAIAGDEPRGYAHEIGDWLVHEASS